MSALADANGREIGYLRYDLAAGEESAVLVVQVVPSAGAFFISGSDQSVELRARKTGTGDPFVSLPDGIDLDAEPEGEPLDFDLKAVAADVIVGRTRAVVWLGVTTRGQAGWTE